METLISAHGEGNVNAGPFDIGIAGRALPGESVSGDMHFVVVGKSGTLLGVVDGLGHGKEAAYAAARAVECAISQADQPLPVIVEKCHASILTTRGVVMSLAFFESAQQTMHWLGVGNVEGVVVRSGSTPQTASFLPCRGGVVGGRLPKLVCTKLHITSGDIIIFATDGIHPNFAQRPMLPAPPQRMADQILAKHARDNDDALVLVARCRDCSP